MDLHHLKYNSEQPEQFPDPSYSQNYFLLFPCIEYNKKKLLNGAFVIRSHSIFFVLPMILITFNAAHIVIADKSITIRAFYVRRFSAFQSSFSHTKEINWFDYKHNQIATTIAIAIFHAVGANEKKLFDSMERNKNNNILTVCILLC